MIDDHCLRQEVDKIRAELKHLDQLEDVLDEARGEFEHELRRAGDALMRAGGRSWGVGTQNVISQSGPKDRPRADATAIVAMHH